MNQVLDLHYAGGRIPLVRIREAVRAVSKARLGQGTASQKSVAPRQSAPRGKAGAAVGS